MTDRETGKACNELMGRPRNKM